jgi:hypothetical protein
LPFIVGNIFVDGFKEPNNLHKLGEFFYRQNLYFYLGSYYLDIFFLKRVGIAKPISETWINP